MSLYLDTSLLVAALTNEANTERIHKWLAQAPAGKLAISEWVATEFSAALSIKLRSGHLETHDRANALAAFGRLCDESLDVWPLSTAQFRLAARFADQAATGLRAGDALHLAICADRRATLCTLDRRLAQAGLELGVATELI